MEFNKKLIGNRIKFERNNLKLTQEELAKKIGLNNKSSISQYENGDAIPGDDIKAKLAEIFSCSLDYLMCKSDIRNPQDSDILGLANVGFSMKDYNPPSHKQKEQIKSLIEVVLKDNKKGDK